MDGFSEVRPVASAPIIDRRVPTVRPKPLLPECQRLFYVVQALRDEVPEQRRAMTIQFVSAVPSEGVSTMATSFAMAAEAEQAGNVLILDCGIMADRRSDVRGSRISAAAAMRQNQPVSVAASSVENSDRIWWARLADEPVGVSVLATLLGQIRQDYDLIILDCPALVRSPKSAAVAQHCDATILVIRSGNTDTEHARNAVNDIRLHNGNLIGVVLNRHHNYLPRWLSPRRYR